MVALDTRHDQREYGAGHEPPSRGFQMPPRTMLLTFDEGSPYCGAELRCTLRMTLEQTLALQRMTSVQADSDVASAARTFAETVLLGWNLLDDDGRPLPATPDNFVQQPADFVLSVINRWQMGVTQPDVPLASPVTNGAPSAEFDAAMGVS